MTPSRSPKRGEAYLVGAQISGSPLPCPSVISVAGTFLSQQGLSAGTLCAAQTGATTFLSSRVFFAGTLCDAKKGVAPVVFVGGDADATVWVLSAGAHKYRETSFSPTGGYSIAR